MVDHPCDLSPRKFFLLLRSLVLKNDHIFEVCVDDLLEGTGNFVSQDLEVTFRSNRFPRGQGG